MKSILDIPLYPDPFSWYKAQEALADFRNRKISLGEWTSIMWDLHVLNPERFPVPCLWLMLTSRS